MSMLQRTIRLLVLGTAMMAGHWGIADTGYHPFSEPLRFDPDWQLFAPSYLQDVEDLTARQRAPHGLFLTYDRIFTGVTRPENADPSYLMDSAWGNRWDFGWMSDRDSGWYFSTQLIAGPNVYQGFRQLRLNGITTDDELDPTDPFFPESFGNDPMTRQRTFDILNSVNVGNYSAFEANKTWRIEPYRYGGMTEWLVGIRYNAFKDHARNDTYDLLGLTDPPDPEIVAFDEIYTQYLVTTSNEMLLGQIGFRYFKYWNQFTMSTELKAFAGHAFQSQNLTEVVQTATYENPIPIGDAPLFDGDFRGTTTVTRKDHATPVGFDARAEGSYRLFRNVDLRAGFQMIYFGQGIWRGATRISNFRQFDNNQQLVMPGLTFGFAINR